MSDPSNFLTNPPSVVVKVKGTARDDVNGQLGIAVQFNDRSRYVVHMVSSQTTMALKPENLEKAGMIDTARAQIEQIRKDPNMQREVTRYYNMVQQRLGVKPEYAAAALLVLIVLAVYFVGFSKAIMALSLVMLVGIVVAPDMGLPLQVMATNFPRRSRETIEQTVPFLRGKLTDQMAAGIMLVMIGFSVYTLLLTAPAAAPAATHAAAPVVSQKAIEEAYKLGFDDANNALEYGASLSKTARGVSTDDTLDYVDVAPPKKKSSWFGMSQAFSIFYIYRTVMELGSGGAGSFSVERLIANARTMEIWKLGILGFSVFNLVRPLLF